MRPLLLFFISVGLISSLLSCEKKYKLEGKWQMTRACFTDQNTFQEVKTICSERLPDSVLFQGDKYIEFYSDPKIKTDTSTLKISGSIVNIGKTDFKIEKYTGTSFTLLGKTKSKSWGFTVTDETIWEYKK